MKNCNSTSSFCKNTTSSGAVNGFHNYNNQQQQQQQQQQQHVEQQQYQHLEQQQQQDQQEKEQGQQQQYQQQQQQQQQQEEQCYKEKNITTGTSNQYCCQQRQQQQYKMMCSFYNNYSFQLQCKIYTRKKKQVQRPLFLHYSIVLLSTFLYLYIASTITLLQVPVLHGFVVPVIYQQQHAIPNIPYKSSFSTKATTTKSTTVRSPTISIVQQSTYPSKSSLVVSACSTSTTNEVNYCYSSRNFVSFVQQQKMYTSNRSIRKSSLIPKLKQDKATVTRLFAQSVKSSSSTDTIAANNNNNNNNKILKQQTFVLDGAEWNSLRNYFLLVYQNNIQNNNNNNINNNSNNSKHSTRTYYKYSNSSNDDNTSKHEQTVEDKKESQHQQQQQTQTQTQTQQQIQDDTTNDMSMLEHYFSSSTSTTSFGIGTIITGTMKSDDNSIERRIIGLLVNNHNNEDDEATLNKEQQPHIYTRFDNMNDKSNKKYFVYTDSIATIPKNINDIDAISTYIHSIVPIHCALPIPSSHLMVSSTSNIISTSTSTSNVLQASIFPSIPTESKTTIVVLGSNDYCSKIVQSLYVANTNSILYVVAQQKNKLLSTLLNDNNNNNRIKYINPSTTNFAQSIITFDSIVDCVGNELINNSNDDSSSTSSRLFTNIGDDDDTITSSSIIQLLKERHTCYQYVSTETVSQQIIIKNGLFAGPKQQKQYIESTMKRITTMTNNNKININQPYYFPSPPKIGITIEKLYNSSIVFTQSITPLPKSNNNVYQRGWSLKDFWEYTTWPRDSSTSNTRYGFPVSDEIIRRNNADDGFDNEYDNEYDNDDESDDEDNDTMMISAAPFRGVQQQQRNTGLYDNDDNDQDEEDDDDDDDYTPTPAFRVVDSISSKTAAGSPSNTVSSSSSSGSDGGGAVEKFSGIAGLRTNIIEPQRSGVLFLSAPFCRTCRYLKPRYSRMSMRYYTNSQQQQNEQQQNNNKNEIIFWNSDTIGIAGKELGRELKVSAVPAFVLFKNGKVYGKPISISQLPSTTLTNAIQLLQSNQSWNDDKIFSTKSTSSPS